MKHGPRYHVKTRRHRNGRTDYRKRLRLLRSRKIRIVVRKSIRHTQVQFVDYHQVGDSVLVTALSDELTKKYNWKHSTATTPAAYLTGFIAGKRALAKGITEGILDIGRSVPTSGSKMFAALKGVLDAGISCPHDEGMLPSDDRILGKHLSKELMPAVQDLKNILTEVKK